MTILLVLLAILLSLAVGAVGAAWLLQRQRAEYVAAGEASAQVSAAGQAAAIEAAVQQVLVEREATASATARAVVADRELTVSAAVDNAVKIASATLEAKLQEGSKELTLRSSSFNERVDTINGQLERVQSLVGQLQQDKAKQHGQLVSQLENATNSTRQLHTTTNALRDALANPKARGQWGERMAEDVLQAAGFVEGINYRKQQTLPTGGIPDFTFLLPRGLSMHMDVKFPIDNYLKFLETDDSLEQDRARTAFARDVRNRIKELQGRGYIDPETTVDSIVLFIPNESVYAFVHENDADVIDVALKQKIVLCSPLTLFSVLAIVRQSVDNFRLERRSSEILDFLGEFRGEWEKFSDHLNKTGRQLDTFQKSFESLGGTRRNVLERKLRHIDELEADESDTAGLVVLDDDNADDRVIAATPAAPAAPATSSRAITAEPAKLSWDAEAS